uniref:Uncharacterized protein n=1 Tax=Oryza meridionalis TaxID=40149 RepID=A0A0E0CL74_9ORYZ
MTVLSRKLVYISHARRPPGSAAASGTRPVRPANHATAQRAPAPRWLDQKLRLVKLGRPPSVRRNGYKVRRRQGREGLTAEVNNGEDWLSTLPDEIRTPRQSTAAPNSTTS